MLILYDRKGYCWSSRITVDAAIRLRDEGGIDVMRIITDEREANRCLFPTTALDAIFLLCESECRQMGLSSGEFGCRFTKASAEAISTAFQQAVIAFFTAPGPPKEASKKAATEITADDLWRQLYRLAGEAGVAPGPHTFGELMVMAEGARHAYWAGVAHQLAAWGDGKRSVAEYDWSGGLQELEATRQRGPVPTITIKEFGSLFGLPKRKRKAPLVARAPESTPIPDTLSLREVATVYKNIWKQSKGAR